jgi:hypothetical protein
VELSVAAVRAIDGVEDALIERVHAGVYQPKRVRIGLFSDLDESVTIGANRPVLRGRRVFQHRERRRSIESLEHVVDDPLVDDAVAVEHEDWAVDFGFSARECVGAPELFLLVGVGDRNVAVLVSEVLLDALVVVADDETDALDAALHEDVENVLEDRSIRGWKHRLRAVGGHRPQPRALPRSEDDTCGDGHVRPSACRGMKLSTADTNHGQRVAIDGRDGQRERNTEGRAAASVCNESHRRRARAPRVGAAL